ncbi:MAG: hypothetical protein WCI66_10950 [Gammaproteobacteria bacterium]
MLLTCVLAHTASATSISLAGSWSYQYPQGNGATVVLSVDRITNNATSGHSGTLRMELWAFATPYAGTSQSGYQLATYQLDTLNAGASLTAVASGNISASFPPTGAWNIALLLSEFNGSSWITQTYALTRITNTLACSAGSCSVVVAPAAASISTSKTSYTLDGTDELVLSGFVQAGTAAGSKVDIYIQAQVDGSIFYYLSPARSWVATPTAMISGFTLADVSAPNFYRLKPSGLPVGTYTFRVLVVKAGNTIASPLATANVQTSFVAAPAPTFTSFNGSWTGTFAGQTSGTLAFSVADSVITVSQPAAGTGTLELAAINADSSFTTIAPTGSCTWTGPFLAGGARQSSASGLWSCGNGTFGTWATTRTPPPTPAPTTGIYDGTYDFYLVYPNPGGAATLTVSRFFIVKDGVISSSDGTVTGTVTNSTTGAAQFTGPCWTSSGGTATFTGNLGAGSPKSGQGSYTCQNNINGGTWRVANGR